MTCCKCSKPVSDGKTEAHVFCGYGFCEVYCPNCCPREVDGHKCDRRHEESR